MPTVNRGEVQTVKGTLDVSAGTMVFKDGQNARATLTQENLVPFPIDFFSGRVWNDLDAVIPNVASGDDLGLIDGAVWGTNAPTLQTIDQDSNGTPTAAYARFRAAVPHNWVSGETLQIVVVGGMVTTVADTTATVDLEIYVPNSDGTVGADLCATAATTINAALLSATPTVCSFDVTTTSLVPGDQLDIRLAITIEDGSTGTAVIGAVSKMYLAADIKG